MIPIFTGQADYIHIHGDEALIIDIKTGWNRPPDPVSNRQLRSLAVLARTAYPQLCNITLQILSPSYDFRPNVMNPEELARYEIELRELIARITTV